jgi:alpha-amylase/alpha-mannosidase (GH57 family)
MEEYSNWREEFIFEVDDQSVQNEKQRVIDVSKKKNKIEINPNMSEDCGCDEKEKEGKIKGYEGTSN